MAAKFRGGSDDWLDDKSSRRPGRRPPSKKGINAKLLAQGEGNATVAEVFSKQARVRMDPPAGAPPEAESRELLVNYKMSTLAIADDEGMRERAPVCVGDRVKVEGDVIMGRCERTNRVVRPAPDRYEKTLHVIASNIDRLVIVMASQNPEFSPGLADRFLIAASAQGIEGVIVINKIDLWTGDPKPWELYERIGYKVFEVSAHAEIGLEPLRELLTGCSTAFCGHSGVGKTSLLNALLPHQPVGRVGEVSEVTGKGRHTTTGALLLRAPGGSRWIDTPGVREFGLHDISPETLAGHFPDIAAVAAQCTAPSCLHADEQGCAAQSLERYPSYRRILASLQAGER